MDIKPVVVKHNVDGYGRNVNNTALFGTRFKFKQFSTTLPGLMKHPANVDPYAGRIAALEGVVGVFCYNSEGAYDVVVRKATAFTWEELEPAIIAILEERHKAKTECEDADKKA